VIECCEGKWTVVEEGGGDEVVVEGESGNACGLARWKGAKVEDEGGLEQGRRGRGGACRGRGVGVSWEKERVSTDNRHPHTHTHNGHSKRKLDKRTSTTLAM
jgi:hypothetical protein